MAIKTGMLALMLMIDLLHYSNGDTFTLVVSNTSIPAQIGSSAVLPCELSPALDVRSYEVCWHRSESCDHPILLYKDQQVQENVGDPQYRGRVSLAGQLDKGNVALKLENITVADRGQYKCYVKSATWYESVSVSLNITVVGNLPVLSFAEAGDQINVTCESEGWLPKPTITWRNKGGRTIRSSFDGNSIDSEGLVRVSSWLLVSPSESDWISCSVGLSDKETREGRVLPVKPVHTTVEPGVSAGWKAFVILLVFSLLTCAVLALLLIPKIRGLIFPQTPTAASGDEESRPMLEAKQQPVTAQRVITTTDRDTQTTVVEKADKGINTVKDFADWENMLSHKVALRPDASTAASLEVGKKKLRVTCKSKVNTAQLNHVLCEERLQSGQYYWEITALTEPPSSENPLKSYICPTSWYVGVVSETAEKKKRIPLTPQNGYWVLHYDQHKGYYVNNPSLTPVRARKVFSTLGVFLDCDKHTLSFYDCDTQSHLYTFNEVDSTKTLIPVLSPGDEPQSSFKISEEKCLK